MFNLAIDSKARGCDVMALKVEDIATQRVLQSIGRQSGRRRLGEPARFELTEQTRQAVDDYLKAIGKRPGEFLFPADTRWSVVSQPGNTHDLVADWIAGIGLIRTSSGTHSLRRTKAKATLIYRRTGNLRAVQLLLGHTKIESTVHIWHRGR